MKSIFSLSKETSVEELQDIRSELEKIHNRITWIKINDFTTWQIEREFIKIKELIENMSIVIKEK